MSIARDTLVYSLSIRTPMMIQGRFGNQRPFLCRGATTSWPGGSFGSPATLFVAGAFGRSMRKAYSYGQIHERAPAGQKTRRGGGLPKQHRGAAYMRSLHVCACLRERVCHEGRDHFDFSSRTSYAADSERH